LFIFKAIRAQVFFQSAQIKIKMYVSENDKAHNVPKYMYYSS